MALVQLLLASMMALAAAVPANLTSAALGRTPRMVKHMVPIRDRQDSSICKYDVVVDQNPARIPNRLDKVLCRQEGCKCVEAGDYHCTQLYAQLNVSYSGPGGVQYETLDVEQACVCSRGFGRSDLQNIAALIV